MLKIGDKVVPLTKTSPMGSKGLETSGQWQQAQKYRQPYLYVTHVSDNGRTYICSCLKDTIGGEYFDEKDLMQYIIPLMSTPEQQSRFNIRAEI